MLKVPEGTLWTRERPLSEKTVKNLIRFFGESIQILGRKHEDTTSLDSDWLYDQPPFSPEQREFLNAYLAKFGLRLSHHHRERNALLCFRHVDIHDDTKTFIDRERSIVFIPLARHEGAEFRLHPGEESQVSVPLENGSIVVFDQNSKHQVVFPLGSHKLKFALSFFVDQIIQSPPSASTHPQDLLSP